MRQQLDMLVGHKVTVGAIVGNGALQVQMTAQLQMGYHTRYFVQSGTDQVIFRACDVASITKCEEPYGDAMIDVEL